MGQIFSGVYSGAEGKPTTSQTLLVFLLISGDAIFLSERESSDLQSAITAPCLRFFLEAALLNPRSARVSERNSSSFLTRVRER